MLGMTWSPIRRARRAGRAPRLLSRTARTSRASFISRLWSTATPAASPSSPRPKAAWTSRKWRTRRRRRSSPSRSIRPPACSPIHGREIACGAQAQGPIGQADASALIDSLYDAFIAKDTSLLEINPLVVTKDGNLICLDAKINFDDNALFRHDDIADAARPRRGRPDRGRGRAARPLLHQARRHDRLHGQRRRPGHGHHGHHQAYGGEPANFLDVGGGATQGAGHRGLQDHPRPIRT